MRHVSFDLVKTKEGHGFAKAVNLGAKSVISKLEGPKSLVLATWKAKSSF